MTNRFDRIGRDTGPGRMKQELATGPKILCIYRLYNYNIDGNLLKPEHTKFLDDYVIPVLKRRSVHAKLLGMASQSGDREYNQQLSIGRVLRVKDYLRSKGIPESKIPGPDVRAAGEDLSTSASGEDPLDRAVLVTIALGIKPWPIYAAVVPVVIVVGGPPGPVIRLPPVNFYYKRSYPWTIRQVSGFNISAGVGFKGVGVGAGPVQYHFLLVDRREALMAQCTFFGMQGNSGGSPFPVGGSLTDASRKWNDFRTRPGITFSDFEGSAVWHEPASLGLGTGKTVTPTLELKGLGQTITVETGDTYGFPATAVSFGYFTCGPTYKLRR